MLRYYRGYIGVNGSSIGVIQALMEEEMEKYRDYRVQYILGFRPRRGMLVTTK